MARILQAGKVKTTVPRAAVIIGAGGASFEIVRYLVERLPILLCPRWVYTESQPISIDNVLAEEAEGPGKLLSRQACFLPGDLT